MRNSKEEEKGVLAAVAAFLIWGILPVYWKELKEVPALEILSHRIIWSLATIVGVVILRGRKRSDLQQLKNKKVLLTLLGTSVLIAINWLMYIWAVNNNRVLESSLGYYINPLLNVILGRLFLGERLTRNQKIAVLLALFGVSNLALHLGSFPWIALVLATSFGLYGLLKKTVSIGSVAGLGVETSILTIPSLFYLFIVHGYGGGALGNIGIKIDVMLLFAGFVTTLPLVLFGYGVKRLKLATTGFIQYLAPTGMFVLGIFVYEEKFSITHLVTFGLIWLGLVIYSVDQYKESSERAKPLII